MFTVQLFTLSYSQLCSSSTFSRPILSTFADYSSRHGELKCHSTPLRLEIAFPSRAHDCRRRLKRTRSFSSLTSKLKLSQHISFSIILSNVTAELSGKPFWRDNSRALVRLFDAKNTHIPHATLKSVELFSPCINLFSAIHHVRG